MTHSTAYDLALILWTVSNIGLCGGLADSSISNSMSGESIIM